MATQLANFSRLDHPEQLPLHSIDQIATTPVLVVAPHPDDETLGCGGAIAALRALAVEVHILVVSDGTQSHPNSTAYPAPKLKALRMAETQAAMDLLGVNTDQITFLELPDGAIPGVRSATFEPVLTRCHHYLSALKPTLIFLPWRYDPHPDHRATWQLINQALVQCNQEPRVIEYPIWDWDIAQRRHIDDAVPVKSWRLDIANTVQLKQQAIAAYRSQTTPLIDDDPQAFRLSTQMLANFAQPWELYFEADDSHEFTSVS
jgi:LmbE family N-acetylglucosaminyl deacetylase